MCGIVGIAGDIRPDHRKAFNDMLLVCQVRGRDSTGAFRVTHRGETEIAKMVGTPEILLDMKRYDNAINAHGQALVGHCRSKTYGEVSIANAHPFKHGHLTGVHNGTLRAHWSLPGANSFGTDSEFLYWMASNEGMTAVIPEVQGAWALVWWDEREKTLNFLRNKERPLYFTYTKDMKVMIWASEIWMTGAFSRAFELWDGGEDGRIFIPLPVDNLYSWKINSNGKEAKDVFTLHKITEIKAKEPEVRGYAGNPNTRGRGGTGSNNGGSVLRPFDPKEVAKNLVRRIGFGVEDLNDPLPDDTETPHLLLLPPELTNTQEESQTTSGKDDKSSKSLSEDTDTKTEKINSKSGKKPTLSLVPPISNNSQSDNNGRISHTSKGCQGNLYLNKGKPLVDFRTVAGVPYISCKKTSKEWSEEEFEDATNATCTFCENPIGDLEEVHQIYTNKHNEEEEVTFLCTSCFQGKVKVG